MTLLWTTSAAIRQAGDGGGDPPPSVTRALPITNGDFETGNLTGWTAVTSSWALSDPFEGTPPYQGNYAAFVASSGNPARLRQDVSLVPTFSTAEIDAGSSFTVQCRGIHTTNNDSDTARLSITPLDGSGVALAAATTAQNSLRSWQLITCTAALPVGTRTLRIELLGTVAGQGSTSNSGFDVVTGSVSLD